MNRDSESSFLEILFIFFRLGCTSFGGPIAHLGYFHEEFVKRRKWVHEHTYSDLVALCQFLPGPASSQVGMALGLSRRGIPGAIAAWLGFTLPSAILLVAFAFGFSSLSTYLGTGWLHGLKVVAVAVVAQALLGMGKSLCPDRERATIAVVACFLACEFSTAISQIGIILGGGLIGLTFLRRGASLPHVQFTARVSRLAGAISLGVFFLLLLALPLTAHLISSPWAQIIGGFFRSGALVFGGGHVVLPLLKEVVVPTGWVSADSFMAGYGAAQAIPGPLFAFTAYLGALLKVWPSGWAGATICLISAFLPSFLLVVGTLPFWEQLRSQPSMRYAMNGINASVVGLLLAAFYNPVWATAIHSSRDFSLAALGFLLLTFWKLPSWSVVLASAVVTGLLI